MQSKNSMVLRGRSRWRLALLATAAALGLLALAGRPVSAAPTLVTSPVSPIPSTADVTFTWAGVPPSGPNIGQVNARLVVDGMAVMQITTAGGSSAPKPYAVGTHTAQIVDNRTAAVLVSIQFVVTERGQPQPPACPDTCFKSVKVTPHGTYATFDIETLTPTKIGVAVYGKPADSKGNFPPGTVVAIGSSASAAKHSLGVVGIMQANTGYFYEIIAVDGNNVSFKKTGGFTTLKRKVEVGIRKIDIDDDSDGGSEGDLKFIFWVNSASKSIEAEADTGETVGLSFCPEIVCSLVYFVVADAPATTHLAVWGRDDDSVDGPFGNDYCIIPGPPLFPTSGSDDSCDWNSDTATAHHDSHKGPNEAYTVTFTLKADNAALRFTVHVMLTVSYV